MVELISLRGACMDTKSKARKSLDSSKQANRKCLTFWYKVSYAIQIRGYRINSLGLCPQPCISNNPSSSLYNLYLHSCVLYVHVLTQHMEIITRPTMFYPVKTVDLTCASNCSHLSSNCFMLASRLAMSA